MKHETKRKIKELGGKVTDFIDENGDRLIAASIVTAGASMAFMYMSIGFTVARHGVCVIYANHQ